MLLAMLGFSVTQHGRSQKLSDAPDIVAVTPSGRTVVVECTVGFPNHGGQISTALQRTEVIRKALVAKSPGQPEVISIIASAMKGDEIVSEKAEAESRGIAVLSSDDYEEALQSLQFVPDADQWLDKLQSEISHLRLMRALRQG